jgi:hypothetical protein
MRNRHRSEEGPAEVISPIADDSPRLSGSSSRTERTGFAGLAAKRPPLLAETSVSFSSAERVEVLLFQLSRKRNRRRRP